MTIESSQPDLPQTYAQAIDPELAQIVRRALPRARLLRAFALGNDDTVDLRQLTAKATGYGIPIRIDVEDDGRRRSFVLHGTSANQFGHDRRADRAAELLLAADTYATIPGHAQVLDVGAFRSDGTSVSLKDSGEFYLLTEYVQGHTYAQDLRRIADARTCETTDLERVRALVDYLVALHTSRLEHTGAYARSLRDLVGSGEGIFGIVDGYPIGYDDALTTRLQRIEARCLAWRWRLRQRPPRPVRIHGDFHPFNVLFDDEATLHVLDTSRGSLGDAADDVTCMAANFVFFALEDAGTWQAAFRPLWCEFWDRYLTQSDDRELLSVAAPFLAWRLLVLACPVWYPNLPKSPRERLLQFAESALDADCFDPTSADAVFR
ncbi:MAG TPA: aminoglycoside phosphotransferase family protein [Polyangiaceae bacterium]|nr:aminoglycoside phosphotransferase family protein [Polyangiaceae bacterium]